MDKPPLTKEERHFCYCMLLFTIESLEKRYNGLCFWLDELFSLRENYPDFYTGSVVEKYFPELYRLANKTDDGDMFFNGWGHRIDAIKKCVAQTER